jgi:hypothetical protein
MLKLYIFAYICGPQAFGWLKYGPRFKMLKTTGVGHVKYDSFQFHLQGNNKFFTSNFSLTYNEHAVKILFLPVVLAACEASEPVWSGMQETPLRKRNTVIQAVCPISCTRVTIILSSAASLSTLTAAASASLHSVAEKRDPTSKLFKHFS